MGETINVFILAAGRGERLRPISDHIPKPLLPVLGKPVMERVLESISSLHFDGIGVNIHYKRDIIESWLKNSEYGDDITLFPEDPVLGTGGGLKNAEAFLKNRPFLVHNADILSDIDLEGLIDFHTRSDGLATLVVHDSARFNNLCINGEGELKMIGVGHCIPSRKLTRVAFTGIAVYSPDFLRFIPRGISSVVEAWDKAVHAGHRISTLDVTGRFWSDIGTPASFASTVFRMLKEGGDTLYVHPTAKGCREATMDGSIVLEENSSISGSSYVKNSIVLPGADIAMGSTVENCIIGDGFKIALDEAALSGVSDETGKVLIGTGGSDRKYYRTRTEGGTAVLMKCRDDDPDFHRHITYSEFFSNCSVPVPSLYSFDPGKKEALFEDFGDLSLYSWLRCPREESSVTGMYQKVMDVAVMLHSRVTKRITECPLLGERIFDFGYFRWETRYFMTWFVHKLNGIEREGDADLNKELDRLATAAETYNKTIIHRDFQSQNIMITRTGSPGIIDFQGARLGPPAYDLASVLWDPYVALEDHMRMRILHYYLDHMVGMSGMDFDVKDFNDSLIVCRLQRHMQALGAYAFLSHMRGKRQFLRHIPRALKLLKEDLSLAGDQYPLLTGLISQLV